MNRCTDTQTSVALARMLANDILLTW